MPINRTFPILAKEPLLRASEGVERAFHAGKARAGEVRSVHEAIGDPLARAATARAAPRLVQDWETHNNKGKHDGQMTSVDVGGLIFTFHKKQTGGGDFELRAYPPLEARKFDRKKLADGISALHGQKNVPTITIMVGGREPKVSINEERAQHLDGDYGAAVLECALALVGRARESARAEEATRAASKIEIEPGVFQDVVPKAPLADRLLGAKPRISAGPLQGQDLVEVVSWNGMPIAVTSDKDGKGPVHVALRRRLDDGKTVWWPIAVPDASSFPRRGCGVTIDGDTLSLSGGVNAKGDVSDARWQLDLFAAAPKDFPVSSWKSAAPLKDAVAWPAAVVDDQENLAIGGVAGFMIQRQNNADAKVPTTRRTFQAGYVQWRDRSPPPSDTTGAHALFQDGVVFVGPGTSCDGSVVAYDKKKSRWVALPKLPREMGMGQLHIDGAQLVYTAGFYKGGNTSQLVMSLRLDDPFASWVERGSCAALQGKTRAVEIDGKLAAIAVTPNGSATLHLEWRRCRSRTKATCCRASPRSSRTRRS